MIVSWIDVTVRLPCDRRSVLVWGKINLRFGPLPPASAFLGVSKYNNCPGIRGRFDVENVGQFSIVSRHVTHWAEITGPESAVSEAA